MNFIPQLWLLTGGNGAGKSTFYQTRLAPLGLPFINADLFAKILYPESPEGHSYEAAKLAEEMRYRLLQEGQSFCFETVFSHPSKIDFVAQAKTLGYQIVLVFIHLESPMLNQARVAQRVDEGGHNVPDEKVKKRIPRLLKHIKVTIPLCDQVWILDNSRADNPFQRVVTIRMNKVEKHIQSLPDWTKDLLAF
ncbi:MAG: AAA family ATPase [Gammaproteobacteria bacterium]|nr:AAA family ATPase [Gammaproteobacteria bacterium]